MKVRTIHGREFGMTRRAALALDAERAATSAALEATVSERARVRAALLADAREFGTDTADSMSDDEIRRAVIAVCRPELAADMASRSAVYVEARYPAVVEQARIDQANAQQQAAAAAKAAADRAEGARDGELMRLERLTAQLLAGRVLPGATN